MKLGPQLALNYILAFPSKEEVNVRVGGGEICLLLPFHYVSWPPNLLTCVLLLPFFIILCSSELRRGTWQVTRVVNPDELGRPDEKLRELMRKLEFSLHRGI